ncbi:MAG TPA: ATP-binding protein [Candidatus Thermoplasmatota archaeon]|nr:ATP-binding protein [Candidatus Thermoplasmatota archaeon]
MSLALWALMGSGAGGAADARTWWAAVVELSAAAHAGAPLQQTFDRAVEIVARTLEVEFAKILQLLPGGKEVLLVAGVGWKPGLVGVARVSTGLDSQAGYTLASAHPVVSEDLRAETRFSGPTLLHAHGVVSGLSVVIPGTDGAPWGVFGAHTAQRRQFGEEHVLFLRAVANVVAGAVARARTEEALRDTRAVLEREVSDRTGALSKAVDDLEAFTAMVAHDLRAPLRGVEHVLGVLEEEHASAFDGDARDLLATARRSTAHMRDLIEALLGLARATQDPLQMRDVDVTALARQRWEKLTRNESGRPAQLRVEDGLAARADPRLLEVVLDNLLGNALKFSREATQPLVEVGAKHLGVGGTTFYVRDNGAGFPSEMKDQLFHPFKRLHGSDRFEGTGVGLATVKRIVERHGGSVWAESDGPGRGATFYFRLLPAGLP